MYEVESGLGVSKSGTNGVSQCLKHLVPVHFKTCSETCLTHASTIPQLETWYETCNTVKRVSMKHVSSAKTGRHMSSWRSCLNLKQMYRFETSKRV